LAVPDFVLAPTAMVPEFIKQLRKWHASFYPDGELKGVTFGKIVTKPHFKRLCGLLGSIKDTINMASDILIKSYPIITPFP
jgi:hypothetical protein